MGDIFWGIVWVGIGLAMIAVRRIGLRQTQQWYDRWWAFKWRPPLWTYDVGWTAGALFFIAFGIWGIVEGAG
jgi:hypothetical protein